MSAKNEMWIQKTWRPLAFYVYALILIFDFIIFPTMVELQNYKLRKSEAVALSLQYTDGGVQALQILLDGDEWQPLTLQENGLLHLSFGAILGAAAWTRGREKIEKAKTDGSKVDSPE